MTPALEDLWISALEIERLSGLEVSDHILNGFLWGAYRLPIWSPRRLLVVVTTESLVLGLMLIFATPLGLGFSRGLTSDHAVLAWIGAIALCLWIIRQVRMWFKAQHLRSFMRLLDEVDHYHQVLQAVDLFEQLSDAEQMQPMLMEALHKARESLIAGLMTEKILRQNHGLLSRRQALLDNIEQNLMTLQSIELQHQAQNYSDILNQAVDISIRVQDEVNKLSHLESSR